MKNKQISFVYVIYTKVMHNIFVLLFSIFIFFTLFLMVEKIYHQKREGLNAQASAPAKLVTSSKFVNYQSNLVDSQYLEN